MIDGINNRAFRTQPVAQKNFEAPEKSEPGERSQTAGVVVEFSEEAKLLAGDMANLSAEKSAVDGAEDAAPVAPRLTENTSSIDITA